MMELVVWWWWRYPMVLPWNGKLSHLATENQIWPDFVSLGFAFLYLSDWLVAKPNRFWKASYGSWICFLFSQKEIKYRNTFTLLMASLCGCEKGKFPFAMVLFLIRILRSIWQWFELEFNLIWPMSYLLRGSKQEWQL